MAIIKCEGCGSDISDKAVKCPCCGTARNPESAAKIEYRYCKECGKILAGDINACPKCGCPVDTVTSISLNPSTTPSTREKLKGLSKTVKIIIVAGFIAIVAAVISIIVLSNILTGDDKVAYELLLEAADNFKNPSSVRIVSGSVGVDKDCLFCGISATNGFGNRTTSYCYISDEGWILEKEDASSFYKSTNDLNVNKINKKLEKTFGGY